MTFVPGLDLHRTWGTHSLTGPGVGGPNDPRDHIAEIDRYLAPQAPIIIVEASTGKRWPFWSELDTNAATGDDERMLIIRPAINFREGERYLVALREMRDSAGNIIPANPTYAAYRDARHTPADPHYEEGRRAEMDRIIKELDAHERAAGNQFHRSRLFLSWEFTVASERNLTERVLHIRDTAFAQLGDTNLADGVIQGVSPKFKIKTVTPLNDSRRLRYVDGTVTVPNFLDGIPKANPESIPGAELPNQALLGRRFLYNLKGLPKQNPVFKTVDIPFTCTLPKAATPGTPAHPMLYGHGLLGSRSESRGGSTDRDRERNFMPCAVDWMGFSEHDLANAVLTLTDPSNMATMADRAQQGFLNFLILGRAMAHPQGFASDPAFQTDGQPIIRTNELFYDGNSQGGIMGGALTALGVDHTRAVLGVPGMNYSTLLNRSVDWEGTLLPEDPLGAIEEMDAEEFIPAYSSVLYTMFPDKKEQQVVMAMIQMLWDRAEGNGYAQHMTDDPLPNTPPHQVMFHVALGDFQVANAAAEVEARTVGARVLDTALMPGRHWSVDGFFGLQPFDRDGNGDLVPHNGSALVYWDSGNLLPPNGNVPPSEDGGDPHEDPRRDPRGGDQKAAFWLTGLIHDVLDGQPYLLCRPGAEGSIPRVPSQFNFDWCV
jgi:hypothetical protein